MTLPTPAPSRRRLTREARTRQLIEVAWTLIRDKGTDALTLARLAEAAGITKPVAYDHFGTRNGLLAVLYEDYDVRQTVLFDAAISGAGPTVKDQARAVADAYVECVLTQGREIQGVLAALSGSPELAAVKSRYQRVFIQKCARIFAPFAGSEGLRTASLWAMLGAADGLSEAVIGGELTEEQAKEELCQTILGMIQRRRCNETISGSMRSADAHPAQGGGI